jgi:hypothetical protein
MIPGRKPESGRPADRSLRDLERRLEASFGALVDDLSIGRGFCAVRPVDRKAGRDKEKVNRGPR